MTLSTAIFLFIFGFVALLLGSLSESDDMGMLGLACWAIDFFYAVGVVSDFLAHPHL